MLDYSKREHHRAFDQRTRDEVHGRMEREFFWMDDPPAGIRIPSLRWADGQFRGFSCYMTSIGRESWTSGRDSTNPAFRPPPTQASILTTLAKKTRKNEGSHTQSSSLSKTFNPRLLKKELSPMGEMGIGVQEKNTL